MQRGLWADPELEYHEAVQFYEHEVDWSNRLILGDSLSVMNSLAVREDLAGKVQMIYVDPPYGIGHRSNFQPFVRNRNVTDRETDLPREPEVVKAYRDTWTLGVHTYLAYLRDRLTVARDLLADSGSIFVQIGDENVHRVQELMDEILGPEQFVSVISFRTKIPLNAIHLPNIADYLVWYAKDKSKMKFRRLFTSRDTGADTQFSNAVLNDGSVVKSSDVAESEARTARPFSLTDLMATGYTESCHFEFSIWMIDWRIRTLRRVGRRHRRVLNALFPLSGSAGSEQCHVTCSSADDYPVMQFTNQWSDTQGATDKTFAVQTSAKVIQRCMLMTTDPGDLVLDPTCGSGTTAYVAEQWGRRWITIDTSRVAIALARQRILTAKFDYYKTADGSNSIGGGGFEYKTVPHVTLGSIAQERGARPHLRQVGAGAGREAGRAERRAVGGRRRRPGRPPDKAGGQAQGARARQPRHRRGRAALAPAKREVGALEGPVRLRPGLAGRAHAAARGVPRSVAGEDGARSTPASPPTPTRRRWSTSRRWSAAWCGCPARSRSSRSIRRRSRSAPTRP